MSVINCHNMSVAISDSFWFNMLFQPMFELISPRFPPRNSTAYLAGCKKGRRHCTCTRCWACRVSIASIDVHCVLPSWKTLRILDLSLDLDQNLNLSQLDQLYPAMGILFHCFATLLPLCCFMGIKSACSPGFIEGGTCHKSLALPQPIPRCLTSSGNSQW